MLRSNTVSTGIHIMQDKIQNISALMRWLVVIIISTLVISSLHSLMFKNVINFGVDPVVLNQLWQNEASNKLILTIFLFISFTLLLGFGYWLQKLFKLFQSGEFFGEENIRCFLWLVWINLLVGIDGLISPALLGLYGHTVDSSIYPKFVFEIIGILTMLLLVVIVYVLKTARQIELENKEFV